MASESTSQHWPLKMTRTVMSPRSVEQQWQIEKRGMVPRYGLLTLICWKRNCTLNITLSLFHCASLFHLHWSKVCWDASYTIIYADVLSYGCAVSLRIRVLMKWMCMLFILVAYQELCLQHNIFDGHKCQVIIAMANYMYFYLSTASLLRCNDSSRNLLSINTVQNFKNKLSNGCFGP